MSLRIWLPLTKDLRQQGLDNVAVTNNGATFNSAGKLGGCYSFDGTDDRIYANNVSINNSAMSACCWVKFNNLTSSDYPYIFALGSNTSGTGIQIGLAVWKSDSKIHLVGNGSEPSSGYTPPTNTWIHLCITINGATTKLYVNGILTNTQTNANSPKTQTCLCLGARPNSTSGAGTAFSYPISGYINDFRLYDHCLSPMEVKELAKGLVLHYPLNRNGCGQENLASQYIMPGGNSPGTTSTAGRTNYYGNYGIIIPATENADTYFSIWYSEPLESGAIYTLSAEVSGLVGNSCYNFPLFAQSNTSMGIMKFNHNGLNTLTFTMNYTGTITTATVNGKTYYRMFMDDNGRTIASGQGAITIKNIKLEKGSIATPWCPNSFDTLATTMGLNSTTEYDCSGFCHNGTRTGTFTWTSDTPKYAVSQDCLGTNYIYLTPPSTEIQTMAVWVKWNTIPSGQSVILVDNGSGIGLGLYSGGILCSTSGAGSSYAFSKANLVANTWYHFVVVKTGTTTRKLYINGVEQTANSSSSNWSYSVNQLQLGKRSTTSDGFVGKLSDFRAYATALSAEDVLSLYQNSAYIDSSGNIYGTIHEV